MTPGVLPDAAEKNLEKQMGCMAGFFQLFDRHQILNGKRVYSAKRLPSSSPATTSPSPSPSEGSDASPTSVCSSIKDVRPPTPPQPPQQRQPDAPQSTTPAKPTAHGHQTLPLPVFSAANSPSTTTATAWKLRDGPRLSLDSRIFEGKPTRLFPREIRTATAPQGHQIPDADAHDRQRSSPSVVARLMGIDNLLMMQNQGPDAVRCNETAPVPPSATREPELRRSASESRVFRDLPPPYTFQPEINSRGVGAAGDEQQQQQRRPDHPRQHGANLLPHNPSHPITAKFVTDKAVGSHKPPLPPSSSSSSSSNFNTTNANTATLRNQHRSSNTPPFPVLHRKTFFDVHDIFPEPAKLPRFGSVPTGLGSSTTTSSVYGEIEKKLRMRGINEPAKDLETLKQILEALQLKGLLHQSRRQRIGGTPGSNVVDAVASSRNLIYNTSNPPLILIKPVGGGARSSLSPTPLRRDSPSTPPSTRLGAASPRRNAGAFTADPRPKRDGPGMERRPTLVDRRGRGNGLPSRSDLAPADVRSPRSPVTARRINSPAESRRNSPAQSPKSTTTVAGGLRRSSPEPAGPAPRTRKHPAAASAARLSDDSSTVSESSYSTISQFDFQKVKIEDYREGRNLLERCDKLLNSIEELTDLGAAASSSRSMEIQQPSPVSVLDASAAFYCDDTTSATGSPSPAASKRCLDFFKDAVEAKQLQRQEQCWTPTELHPGDEAEAGDGDFLYVTQVLRASAGTSGTVDEDVFYFLEKRRQQQQQFHGDPNLERMRLHRRLVFDTVVEIVDKKRQVSTWEAFLSSQQSPSSFTPAGGGRAVWEELKQIRECGDPVVPADDFFEAVCAVLKKDMAMDLREPRGWGNRSGEMSDAVLDIERLIFKDLVAETIRDLAATVATSSSSAFSTSSGSGCNNCRSLSVASALAVPRRKLVF